MEQQSEHGDITVNWLPKYLCSYAVLTASYIRNRCYNTRLNETPYETFTGVKPSVQNMNIFLKLFLMLMFKRRRN